MNMQCMYLFSVPTEILDSNLVFNALLLLMHLSTSAERGVQAAILESTTVNSLYDSRLAGFFVSSAMISFRLLSFVIAGVLELK